jgi:hypothetical protein
VPAIQSTVVFVDQHVIGHEWSVADMNELACLVAIVLLGQAEHAAEIIANLEPSLPAFTDLDLIDDAKRQMKVKGSTEDKKRASRTHRDGFLFECISWIAARQAGDDRTFLKDPHLDPTSHGLDGLIVQLHATDGEIVRSTICEDKCTAHPRTRFRDDVMKIFREHHHSTKRARDLVANAVALLRVAGLSRTEATKAAAKVMDKSARCYLAALTTGRLATLGRAQLFRGYDDLDDIDQDQRVGAMLPLTLDLRDWFQTLADEVINALDSFAAAKSVIPSAKSGTKRV